jgi:hypothetical protein
MDALDGQWSKLTVRERIHLCREYAREAEQLAQAAHPDRKADYKRLAADWNQIAAELEHHGTAKSAFPAKIDDSSRAGARDGRDILPD